MYNLVSIGDKEVPMMAMASVDVYYRNIFHEDPVKREAALDDAADAVDFYTRMGFVMAKFAELKSREKMKELREDDFIDWLDGFDRMDMANALTDVQKTYNGQAVTHADAKKNKDEPSEE